MIDMVPKAIMLNLVAYAKDELQRELLENLYRSTTLDDLLKESEVSSSKDNLTIVHYQQTEGMPTDGGIVDSGQRDCFSSLDRCMRIYSVSRNGRLDFGVWHSAWCG
jgi:hypothetical protein